jgi:hypothetical protein
MRLSTFNSFLALFRKRADLAGAGSRGFLTFNLLLAICLVSTSIIVLGVIVTRRQASAQATGETIIFAPIRFTSQEDPISLFQLLSRNGQLPPLQANQRVVGIRVILAGDSSEVNFTKLAMKQPPGHVYEVCDGETRDLEIPEQTVSVQETLSNFVATTSDGICNFVAIIRVK